MPKFEIGGAFAIPSLLYHILGGGIGKGKAEEELKKQMSLLSTMGIEPSQYSPDMRAKIADLAKKAGLGTLPKDTGPLVEVGRTSPTAPVFEDYSTTTPNVPNSGAPFLVNQPTNFPAPFPPTMEDIQRNMYKSIHETDIMDKVSQINAREAAKKQEEQLGLIQQDISMLKATKGAETLTGVDLQKIDEKYPMIDPNKRQQSWTAQGINPIEILESDKANIATKNIKAGLDNGKNISDLKWMTTNVFPYVKPEKMVSLYEKFIPDATKETPNDYFLNLMKMYVQKAKMSPEQITVLINYMKSNNSAVAGIMEAFEMSHLKESMSKDPVVQENYAREYSEKLRKAILMTNLPGLESPTPVPTPVPAPAPKIKSNQVPQGGAPREKRPIATHRYNPSTGRIEEVR